MRWSWLGVITVGVLLGLIGLLTLQAAGQRDDLVTALERAVEINADRDDQIDDLRHQLRNAQDTIGRLEKKVSALVDQLGELGAVPVVIEERRASSVSGQQATTTTEPAPGKSGEHRRDRGR